MMKILKTLILDHFSDHRNFKAILKMAFLKPGCMWAKMRHSPHSGRSGVFRISDSTSETLGNFDNFCQNLPKNFHLWKFLGILRKMSVAHFPECQNCQDLTILSVISREARNSLPHASVKKCDALFWTLSTFALARKYVQRAYWKAKFLKNF